jgi:hypothetical protein
VLSIDCIGPGNKFLIPAGIARFVTADQQNSGSPSIERVQNPIRSALMLTSQLFHVRVAGAGNRIGMRPFKVRTTLLQQSNSEVDAILLVLRQAIPPGAELIGVLNFPSHKLSMAQTPYAFKAILFRGEGRSEL